MAHGIRSFSGTPDIHRNISVVKPKLKHWFGNISYIFFSSSNLDCHSQAKRRKNQANFRCFFWEAFNEIAAYFAQNKKGKRCMWTENRTEPSRRNGKRKVIISNLKVFCEWFHFLRRWRKQPTAITNYWPISKFIKCNLMHVLSLYVLVWPEKETPRKRIDGVFFWCDCTLCNPHHNWIKPIHIAHTPTHTHLQGSRIWRNFLCRCRHCHRRLHNIYIQQ